MHLLLLMPYMGGMGSVYETKLVVEVGKEVVGGRNRKEGRVTWSDSILSTCKKLIFFVARLARLCRV